VARRNFQEGHYNPIRDMELDLSPCKMATRAPFDDFFREQVVFPMRVGPR